MPNGIKYSTDTQSLALKKGNFYIGTGDVGKGPTSTTGYYKGISPPNGGYTIYVNKEAERTIDICCIKRF
jgi:energy-coupling factor transporter ATP-binding protein EcfA2